MKMKITRRQLRRIIREQMEATPVVFDEERFGYTINGQRVPDEAMGNYTIAAENGDVQAMAMHLKKMGVTHAAGDIDTLDALGLGPDDIITVDEWLSFRNSVR
jgi:hypothetical protein